MFKLRFVIPVLLLCGAAAAQDVMKVAANHYKVLKQNDCVRVVENTLGPGEKDPQHTHPAGWYYVTKPGTMKTVFADGKVVMWNAKAGEAGWLDGEGPHTSENVGKAPMGYVLVEVRGSCKAPEKTAAATSK